MSSLLDGIRVIDLTRYVSGPHCTMMLAEMGAEVIKIEKPGSGDDNRQNGPWVGDQSLLYVSCNMSKKGISLNLRSSEGKDILSKLIVKADVLVENFRPGTMEEMGLGYDRVKEINPRIIMASISGFGQTGPNRDKTCFDGIAQAMGGLIDSVWESGGVRCTTGGNLGDVFAGTYAAMAIGMALFNRESSEGLLDSIKGANSDSDLSGSFTFPEGSTLTYDVNAPQDLWVMKSEISEGVERKFERDFARWEPCKNNLLDK